MLLNVTSALQFQMSSGRTESWSFTVIAVFCGEGSSSDDKIPLRENIKYVDQSFKKEHTGDLYVFAYEQYFYLTLPNIFQNLQVVRVIYDLWPAVIQIHVSTVL